MFCYRTKLVNNDSTVVASIPNTKMKLENRKSRHDSSSNKNTSSSSTSQASVARHRHQFLSQQEDDCNAAFMDVVGIDCWGGPLRSELNRDKYMLLNLVQRKLLGGLKNTQREPSILANVLLSSRFLFFVAFCGPQSMEIVFLEILFKKNRRRSETEKEIFE